MNNTTHSPIVHPNSWYIEQVIHTANNSSSVWDTAIEYCRVAIGATYVDRLAAGRSRMMRAATRAAFGASAAGLGEYYNNRTIATAAFDRVRYNIEFCVARDREFAPVVRRVVIEHALIAYAMDIDCTRHHTTAIDPLLSYCVLSDDGSALMIAPAVYVFNELGITGSAECVPNTLASC